MPGTRDDFLVLQAFPPPTLLFCRLVGPDYATIYPVAQITKLPPPSPIPAVIYEGAMHWQLCDAHQLTEFTYPAHVPVKDRLPSVRQLSGVHPSSRHLPA